MNLKAKRNCAISLGREGPGSCFTISGLISVPPGVDIAWEVADGRLTDCLPSGVQGRALKSSKSPKEGSGRCETLNRYSGGRFRQPAPPGQEPTQVSHHTRVYFWVVRYLGVPERFSLVVKASGSRSCDTGSIPTLARRNLF